MQRTFGGDRQLSIARELTKIHEQIFFGSITSAVQALSEGVIPSKGEFVIIVEGASESAVLIDPGLEKVMQTLINELPASRAADVASKLTGESRKSLYEIAVSFKKSNLK
jgi:16S rRNA (cytidine1402-2'-O)-methyltransferase